MGYGAITRSFLFLQLGLYYSCTFIHASVDITTVSSMLNPDFLLSDVHWNPLEHI